MLDIDIIVIIQQFSYQGNRRVPNLMRGVHLRLESLALDAWTSMFRLLPHLRHRVCRCGHSHDRKNPLWNIFLSKPNCACSALVWMTLCHIDCVLKPSTSTFTKPAQLEVVSQPPHDVFLAHAKPKIR